MAKNSKVDELIEKETTWQAEMKKLRAIMLATPLAEEVKWNLPCYTHEGKNIAIIQPFKACLGLMFFKGSLLKDAKKVLKNVGERSQSARRLEFISSQEITKLTPVIKAYCNEAIAIEESGQKVEFKKKPEPVPQELKDAFKKKPALKKAFEALTPGRQRGYIYHFSSAKQSATRQSRIEKAAPKILKGKGLQE